MALMSGFRRLAVLWSFLIVLALTPGTAFAQETAAVGKTVSVNGIDLYYETSGHGEPLVLLHGFNAAGVTWARLVPEFTKSYQVIVPDLRGHGRSTNPARQFTHRQSALDVFALLDAIGIRQFKAMGISTGGMTLIHMATQQPSRVEAMVLIGATIYFPEQARAIMRTVTIEGLTQAECSALDHSAGPSCADLRPDGALCRDRAEVSGQRTEHHAIAAV